MCDALALSHERSEKTVADSAPELASTVMFLCSQGSGVRLRFIEPGKPHVCRELPWQLPRRVPERARLRLPGRSAGRWKPGGATTTRPGRTGPLATKHRQLMPDGPARLGSVTAPPAPARRNTAANHATKPQTHALSGPDPGELALTSESPGDLATFYAAVSQWRNLRPGILALETHPPTTGRLLGPPQSPRASFHHRQPGAFRIAVARAFLKYINTRKSRYSALLSRQGLRRGKRALCLSGVVRRGQARYHPVEGGRMDRPSGE